VGSVISRAARRDLFFLHATLHKMRSRSKEHDRCQLSSVPTVSSTAARRCRQKGRRDCYKKNRDCGCDNTRLRLRQHATAVATTRDSGCDNTRRDCGFCWLCLPRLRLLICELLLAVFATTAAQTFSPRRLGSNGFSFARVALGYLCLGLGRGRFCFVFLLIFSNCIFPRQWSLHRLTLWSYRHV
jgi:hypothetical protein